MRKKIRERGNEGEIKIMRSTECETETEWEIDRQTEREIEGQPDTGRGRGRGRGREKCEKLMKRMKERQWKTERH